MKKPLVVITGPTAAGKSALSIALAKAIDGEIISGDSMQVYRGMDIGTAKIRPEEMQGVPHHMIDILEPEMPYDAYAFKEMAGAVLEDIYSRGRIPIVVGGTGFYIRALAYDTGFAQGVDEEYRGQLEEIHKSRGAETLFDMLKEVDPDTAAGLSPNNTKRVIRALEFYKSTGEPISMHNTRERQKESPYELRYFVLFRNRELLYQDINKRVDIMIKDGLLEEARGLYENGKMGPTSEKAIGYQELYRFFKGEWDMEYAISMIKQNTRHFAKRQMTWFNKEYDAIRINKDEFFSEEEILKYMLEKING